MNAIIGQYARALGAMAQPVDAPSVGERLVEALGLPDAALHRAQAASARTGAGIGRTLIALGLVEEMACARALATLLDLPRFDETMLPPAPLLPEKLPPAFLRLHHVVPLAIEGDCLRLATIDPENDFPVKAVSLATGHAVALAIATTPEVEASLALLCPDEAQSNEILRDEQDQLDADRLRDASSDAPVIRWVSQMFAQAVDRRASDIHLEPLVDTMRVRLRVDGRMIEVEAPPRALGAAVRSRIKLLAGMDIAEFRLPQDGRIKAVARGRTIDLRVATLPTASGREAITIRLLDRAAVRFDFHGLGFEEESVAQLRRLCRADHGIVLVTGPTGSGKTTTLYTAVNDLKDGAVKIVTVEDPVEYAFDGIVQVQVQPQIGLDFASVLRASLRHNPDILLVGEVRDRETAQVAVQASLTGHVVLATLHTNNALATIARLVEMGIDPYLIGSTLTGVLAQRLVPLLCPECREPDPVAAAMLARTAPEIADPRPMRAVGCRHCSGTGTAGRAVIYEFLIVDEAIATAIASDEEPALPGGFRTMERHALERAARGECALAEAMRLVRMGN